MWRRSISVAKKRTGNPHHCCLWREIHFLLSPRKKKNEWKRLANGPTKRNHETQMIKYHDELYAFPSTDKAERYDPVLNCWSTLDYFTTNYSKVTLIRGEIFLYRIIHHPENQLSKDSILSGVHGRWFVISWVLQGRVLCYCGWQSSLCLWREIRGWLCCKRWEIRRCSKQMGGNCKHATKEGTLLVRYLKDRAEGRIGSCIWKHVRCLTSRQTNAVKWKFECCSCIWEYGVSEGNRHSMCWVAQEAHCEMNWLLNAMTLKRTSGSRRQPYQ